MHASLYLLYILLVHRVPQTLGQEGSHGSPFVTYTIHVSTRSSVVIHLCLFGNLSTTLLSAQSSRRLLPRPSRPRSIVSLRPRLDEPTRFESPFSLPLERDEDVQSNPDRVGFPPERTRVCRTTSTAS